MQTLSSIIQVFQQEIYLHKFMNGNVLVPSIQLLNMIVMPPIARLPVMAPSVYLAYPWCDKGAGNGCQVVGSSLNSQLKGRVYLFPFQDFSFDYILLLKIILRKISRSTNS